MHQIVVIPDPINPMLHPIAECFFVPYGNVGLAPMYFESGSGSCELPAGMILYVIVVTGACRSAWGDGETEEELRACAESLVQGNLHASIDGIPVDNLEKYTVTSPLFELDFPIDNIFGLPAGPSDAVSYGTGFFTTPLNPGVHEIYVYGEVPSFGFVYEWTYNITVTK
jgi:hypothetical protein